MQDLAKHALDKNKVVVNTCGWVEGLGAEILFKVAKMVDSQSTQFICLESPSKSCEVNLSSLGVWKTVIKGDVRFPKTGSPADKLNHHHHEHSDRNRNKRLINSLLPPLKPNKDHKYHLEGFLLS